MTLPTQILVALVLGLASGVFFGELITPIRPLGDAFVLLLQMTVLPYVLLSLVTGLGSLKAEGAAALALRVGGAMAVLWSAAIAAVLLMPVAFPDWKSASYFSTSLTEVSEAFDFLHLFIPANPFRSLSDAVVPSVVVFSSAVGVALIGLEEKDGLLRGLETLRKALARITNAVIRLAPFGIFGIAANAAGTLPVGQAVSLQIYMLIYALSALVLALWTLPGLVAAITPYGWREVLGHLRGAMLTAFATGSVFVVLSILAVRCKELVEADSEDADRAKHMVDVVIPVAFTFPSAGKLLSLSFVLFAGWTSGFSVSVAEYPKLLAAGLPSYFGSDIIAIPFLLDLFRIPADTFQLFLVANNVVGTRFGAMVAAIHLVSVALIAIAGVTGRLVFNPVRIVRYLVITAVLMLAPVLIVRVAASAIDHEYLGYNQFVNMQTILEGADRQTVDVAPAVPDGTDLSQPTLKRIRDRGTLRVGYIRNRLPWVFQNDAGKLVGFDVEMAGILARELKVDLALFEVERENLASHLNDGSLDIVMSGIPLTTDSLMELAFSDSYVDETIAFVVRDHRRDDYASRASVKSLGRQVIAVPPSPYYRDKLARYVPNAKLVGVDSPRDFFRAEEGTFDALLYTAESGSTWSLIYPEFTVAVPQPDILKVPLAYGCPRGDVEMVNFVNAWLELKRRDNTIDRLFDYWILGQMEETSEPRWSVIRNVLGWVQ